MPEENIEPVEVEASPFIYVVPSTFTYVSTDDTTDIFAHPGGCELFVVRLTFTGGDASPSDALTQMYFRAEEVPSEHSRPVLLSTGFAFMSYEAQSEDDGDSVHLFCELCGFSAPKHLAVIRYETMVRRDYLHNPEVAFYSHLVRKYSRLTRFA